MTEQPLPSFVQDYVKDGLTLIPIKSREKDPPLVKWKEFQTRQPTGEELAEWFHNRDVNLAVVCGSISNNLCILDFDSPENYHRFFDSEKVERETPVVKTSRGVHVWLRSDRPIRSFDIEGLVEIKSEGKYCLVPPSIHPSGRQYEFVNSIRQPQLIMDLERSIWKKAEQLGFQKRRLADIHAPKNLDGSGLVPNCIATLAQGVKSGSRNDSAIHLASYWLNLRHLSSEETSEWLKNWNLKNDPPLETEELRQVLESATRGYTYGCCLDSEASRPLNFNDVAQILGSTVKHDRAAKLVVFLSMLLTYTEEEQVNVLMAAESSAGKSYLPLEISLYFPDSDVIVMGGASPTAFFHEVSGGEFATWDPDKKQSRVNLANKILIFLDQPHDQLLQKLRPFLSHDRKEIKYKISDRSQKAGLRTKTVILVGFSTVVFCTAKFDLDQQERTRVFQLSPETDASKVDAALDLLLEKKCDRDTFRETLLGSIDRKLLTRRIVDIRNAGLRDVLIPAALKEQIKKIWKHLHSHSIPRHTRDLDRFLSLVKASALLNWRARTLASNNRCEATVEDLDEALGVYKEIAEANELGLAPQVYEIYKQIIEPLGTYKVSETEAGVTGVTRQMIQREYFRVNHRSLPERRLRGEILPPLEASGLIREEQDPADKRRTLVYPQIPGPICGAKGVPPEDPNNRAGEVGVDSWTENPPLLHPGARWR